MAEYSVQIHPTAYEDIGDAADWISEQASNEKAAEWLDGIRVNILSPGPVETPIYGKTGLPQEAVEGLGEQLGGRVPLGRFGTPDEMANVALFLASDESSYITGADIQADGGLTQAF